MTDKEFQKLQQEIHKAMLKLGELQKLHREQTGRDYVVSGWMQELEGENSQWT